MNPRALKTLNCPSCGGAVASDSTACQYCGARLQTVACPQCFGAAFVGSRFCPHCGAALAQVADDGTSILPCPRCHAYMQQRTIDGNMITECDRCAGLWLDAKTFERICADHESQAAVLGTLLGPRNNVTFEASPKYVPCPRCGELMNRLNFAHCSGVIIDICKPHGIWFDRDELRRIIEFIRAGGLARAREDERLAMEAARQELHAAQRIPPAGQVELSAISVDGDRGFCVACRFVGGLLRTIVR